MKIRASMFFAMFGLVIWTFSFASHTIGIMAKVILFIFGLAFIMLGILFDRDYFDTFVNDEYDEPHSFR